MSEENKQIKVPPPPMRPDNQVYYLIYGEWTQIQVIDQSPIVTPENPNPTPQVFKRTIGLNECIDIHPAIFLIMAQQQRPAYQIKWAMGVNKEIYTWYREVERLMERAARELQEADKK